jgi:predicted tellurium resistance membrane protein TerC
LNRRRRRLLAYSTAAPDGKFHTKRHRAVPKGYVYVAMLFSLSVEALNIRARSKRQAAAQV